MTEPLDGDIRRLLDSITPMCNVGRFDDFDWRYQRPCPNPAVYVVRFRCLIHDQHPPGFVVCEQHHQKLLDLIERMRMANHTHELTVNELLVSPAA